MVTTRRNGVVNIATLPSVNLTNPRKQATDTRYACTRAITPSSFLFRTHFPECGSQDVWTVRRGVRVRREGDTSTPAWHPGDCWKMTIPLFHTSPCIWLCLLQDKGQRPPGDPPDRARERGRERANERERERTGGGMMIAGFSRLRRKSMKCLRFGVNSMNGWYNGNGGQRELGEEQTLKPSVLYSSDPCAVSEVLSYSS